MSEHAPAYAVWYVAYGSNLALDRFRCYLSGGRPEQGMREYAGCRDPSDPARTVGLFVPGGIVFAGESTVWGGGMAFFDGRAPGMAACRAYLISSEQFADVAAQEMRRPSGGEFALRLAEVLGRVDSVHTLGPGRYETVARLGVLDGAPLLTVTHGDIARLDLTMPSDAYLSRIATGLREAHRWDTERIAAYLALAPGAFSWWTVDQITDIVRQTG